MTNICGTKPFIIADQSYRGIYMYLIQHEKYINKINPILDAANLDDFHRGRYLGIGGSDAPVIMGKSPFKTKHALFLEKTFKEPLADLSDNFAVIWGHLHEPTIRDYFAQKNNVAVKTFNKPFLHPDYPWIRANIDGLLPDNEILEIKTASAYTASKWGTPVADARPGFDDALNIPLDYLIQIQLYMTVLESAKTRLVVLIGSSDYREYTIFTNPFLRDKILSACQDFWLENIIPDKAPESANFTDVLNKSPLAITGSSIESTPYLDSLVSTILDAKKSRKESDALIADIRFEIANFMGEFETLVNSNGENVVTFKHHTSRPFDTVQFKKDHPILAKKYISSSTTRVLRNI